MPNKVTLDQWLSAVESYVGTKFLHMGKNRNGVDCFGLLVAAAEDLGIADSRLYSINGYRSTPAAQVLQSHIGEFLDPRPYNRLQGLRQQALPGDVIVFRVDHHATPRHMGVYFGVGPDKLDIMVHADASMRRVVKTSICPSRWLTKVKSVWSVRQIER